MERTDRSSITCEARELRHAARGFRSGMLLEGKPSQNMCYMISAPLCGYLNFCGYHCRLVEGRVSGAHHFWIETVSGLTVDATADQFPQPNGKPMTAVYVGKKPEWYLLLP